MNFDIKIKKLKNISKTINSFCIKNMGFIIKNCKNYLILLLFFTNFNCVLKNNFEVLSEFEPHLIYKGDYTSYLGLEYLGFARKIREVDIHDEASEYFSEKGLAIISGSLIIPENPLDWDADPAQIQLMILMQNRLEELISKDSLKKSIPIQLAHLVYLYDCWISKESKPVFIADELARCRVRFTKLLNEIEYYVKNLNKDKTKPVKIIEPKFEVFKIYFDTDSSKLNDKAFKDLYQALAYIESLNKGFRLLLAGNADRSGNSNYNKNLSLNRVLTVKKYLTKSGISEDFIKTKALGEEFPEIITKNNKSSQSNRLVEIYVIQGLSDDSINDLPIPLIKNHIYKEEIEKARKKMGLES